MILSPKMNKSPTQTQEKNEEQRIHIQLFDPKISHYGTQRIIATMDLESKGTAQVFYNSTKMKLLLSAANFIKF